MSSFCTVCGSFHGPVTGACFRSDPPVVNAVRMSGESKCDAIGCTEQISYRCICRRCSSEQLTERFHACPHHISRADEYHRHVRGSNGVWIKMCG